MYLMESGRQGGIRAFFAFAMLISVSNNYYWSLRSSSPPEPITTALEQSTPPSSTPPPIPTKPILFIHFHKSGGTRACALLKQSINVTDASGRRVDEASLTDNERDLLGNCNAPFSGPNADVRLFSSLQTCRHLLPYAVDKDLKPRINVVAVEVPFQDAMPCQGFRSFAIMRHPVTRLLSHIAAHRNWNEQMIMRYARNRQPPFNNYYLDGYPIVNSMVIRQLLGRDRFVDPLPVNKVDLARAKAIVDKIDAFVPMEHLEHPAVEALLNKTVPEYLVSQRRLSRAFKNKGKSKPYSPSEAFVKVATEENKFDILLYEYVLAKFGLQSV